MQAGRRKENDSESDRAERLDGGGGQALSAEAPRVGAQLYGQKCWPEQVQDTACKQNADPARCGEGELQAALGRPAQGRAAYSR